MSAGFFFFPPVGFCIEIGVIMSVAVPVGPSVSASRLDCSDCKEKAACVPLTKGIA